MLIWEGQDDGKLELPDQTATKCGMSCRDQLPGTLLKQITLLSPIMN
jgi:hypothetical protein